MINEQLLNPKRIIVVGGSNNVDKPGGNMLRNIITNGFQGEVFVVNPKEKEVQGCPAFPDVHAVPEADLAVLAIPSQGCLETVDVLSAEKGVRAFIIISAGFGEETAAGAALEHKILKIASERGCSVLGPNCIGMINQTHCSVFTSPVPALHADGVDFVSSSGATALFIIQAAMLKGLRFHSVFSVGNGGQIGVEDLLEYMDKTYEPGVSPRIKLLYIESIKDPDRFLDHASSLIEKGCSIAAIKSGSTESGTRAASSHTGAMANPDLAVDALFRKAGIVRCYSREELATVACIFTLKPLKGRRFGIVTHAGGPAVILSDALSKGGLEVPEFKGPKAEELKTKLYPGAAVGNPCDILGTGNAEHLGVAIDYYENYFDEIDAIAVIFGSTGLGKISATLKIIGDKIKSCKKPIFPILPSLAGASEEVQEFVNQGNVNFSDEAELASAVSRVINTPRPAEREIFLRSVDIPRVRQIIDSVKESGYLSPEQNKQLLNAAGIHTIEEYVGSKKEALIAEAERIGYPVVAKVVGPLHKSDVGGVVLDIKSSKHLALEFDRMMQIPQATGVMIQRMAKGKEIFLGAKYEERFGHVVLCGLGGIFVEVFKDVTSGLAPLTMAEAYSMINSLRAKAILSGTRGQKGINVDLFAEIIVRLSSLLRFATEIKEMDINPLLATEKEIIAVDSRIRIEK